MREIRFKLLRGVKNVQSIEQLFASYIPGSFATEGMNQENQIECDLTLTLAKAKCERK